MFLNPSPVLGQGSLCSTNTSVCPAWAKFGQKHCGVLFKLLGFCSCFLPRTYRAEGEESQLQNNLGCDNQEYLRRFGAQKERKNL